MVTKAKELMKADNDLSKLTDAELRQLQSPQDLIDYYEANNITVADIRQFGDGFPVLIGKSKDRVVGKPFHLIGWKSFESKKYLCDGIMAWIMCENVDPSTGEYERYRIVDMSTGIAKQLINNIQMHQPMRVPGGLVRSEYDTEIDGKTVHGVTYYLDITPTA